MTRFFKPAQVKFTLKIIFRVKAVTDLDKACHTDPKYACFDKVRF